jgi:hypothetical protein
MPSTNATSEKFDSTSVPDLFPLYALYLAAFNNRWPEILKYHSPTCHSTIRGKLMDTSAEEMRPNYEKDFDRCEGTKLLSRR